MNYKDYKALVIQSPTGSGKTYELILQALYNTFCFKKTSIISTKNKKLVDQIYNITLEIYRNQEIRDKKISDKKIFILKHTKDDHLSKDLILDLFVKGDGIIITVHNYLSAFDDFYNISFLNAISYTFPFLVDIYFDEGNFYIGNNYSTYTLNTAITKHNDTLVPGSKFYHNEDWSDLSDINDAIMIVRTNYSKSTGDDNISYIKENNNSLKTNIKTIELNTLAENGEKHICFYDNNTEKFIDKIPLSKENLEISTKTSKKYLLNLNSNFKMHFKREKENILIYNYLSIVLKTILGMINPRKREELNGEFTKIITNLKGNNQEKLDTFFIKFNSFVKMSYFENYLYLTEENKDSFYLEFDSIFEKYKEFAIDERRLFNIVSIDNGSESLLRLIYTSHKSFVTNYYSYALICNIELIKISGREESYEIKITGVKETPIDNEIVLYKLKKNTDKIKNIINIIKQTCLKKDNSLIQENQENNEIVDDNIGKEYTKHIRTDFQKIKNFKVYNASETNKQKLHFELKKIFENYYIYNKENEDKIEFEVFLKIENPSEAIPFGSKIEIIKDNDLSRRLMGERRIFVAANFDPNDLKTFDEINKNYSIEHNINIEELYLEKINSDRKIDKLYILCNNLNYTSTFSKKDFLQTFWNNFAKGFYDTFDQNKPLEEKKFGMIALPSNKKVSSFFNYMAFKNYMCYISANEQKTNPQLDNLEDESYTRNFSPNQKLIQSGSLVTASVFSTASIGLNIPHMFYLFTSLNNHKPKHLHHTISVEINNKLTDPTFKVIYDSLIQIVGRMSREDPFSKNQIRILELQKHPPCEDMLFFHVFINHLLKVFKTIHLIDIEDYEILSFSLIRSKKLKLFFNIFHSSIKKDYTNNLSINICGKYLANFKISILNLLKNETYSEDFNILFLNIIKKYYTEILNIALTGIIGQMYDYFCNSLKNKNKKLTYSKFKESLALSKLPLYNNLYDYLEFFYEELSKSDASEKDFIELYNLYEKENKFNLIKFIDTETQNLKLNIFKF